MSNSVLYRVAEAIYQRRNPGRDFGDETGLVQRGYRHDAVAALTAADALVPTEEAEEADPRTCMNPYCENPGTVKLQVFANDVGVACDVCAHFPHAYWIKRNGEPNERIAQDLKNRSRNRPNHLLEEQLDRAIHFACHESDWNWKAEEGVPSPYDAMLPIVLAVFEAIDQPVTDVVNQCEDYREHIVHLRAMAEPTAMPLEWMEPGHPTPQEVHHYIIAALTAEAGGGPAGSSDAAEWPKPKPSNDLDRTGAELPDFDAATAYQEAAMAEQRARIAAEERLEQTDRFLQRVQRKDPELVNSLAEAIYKSPNDQYNPDRRPWDEHDDTVHEHWRTYAKGALEALADQIDGPAAPKLSCDV